MTDSEPTVFSLMIISNNIWRGFESSTLLINYAVIYKAFQLGFKNMESPIIFMTIFVEKVLYIYYYLVSRTLIILNSISHILFYIPCTKDHMWQASCLVQTTASHHKEDLWLHLGLALLGSQDAFYGKGNMYLSHDRVLTDFLLERMGRLRVTLNPLKTLLMGASEASLR